MSETIPTTPVDDIDPFELIGTRSRLQKETKNVYMPNDGINVFARRRTRRISKQKNNPLPDKTHQYGN